MQAQGVWNHKLTTSAQNASYTLKTRAKGAQPICKTALNVVHCMVVSRVYRGHDRVVCKVDGGRAPDCCNGTVMG